MASSRAQCALVYTLFDGLVPALYNTIMREWKNVAVGILRPSSTEHSRLMRDEVDPSCNGEGNSEYAEHVNSRIAELRQMFQEAAQKLRVKCALTEYQLHDDDSGIAVPLHRRAQCAAECDILVTYDPTPTQFNFVTRSRGNYLQRAVMAFSDREQISNSLTFLAASTVPIFAQAQERYAQRIFALHLPLNDEVAANSYQDNLKVVRAAVRYPYIESEECSFPSASLLILDETDPLSFPENRHHLCEPDEEE